MDYKNIWKYMQINSRDRLLGAKNRIKHVTKQIDKLPNIKNILDVGFGDGFLIKTLSGKYSVYGIDFIEENVELTKKTTGLTENIKFGLAQKIPFEDNKFDLVIATEVFEHLSDDELRESLKEISRVLNTRGFLIVTVPYNEDLSKKVFCCPKCNCEFHIWGHKQSFSENNVKAKFNKHFNVIKVEKMVIGDHQLNFFGKVYLILRKIFKKYKSMLILLQVKK